MSDATAQSDAPISAAVRILRPILAAIITLGSLSWAADLYRAVGLVLFTEQLLAAAFGTALALVYLHFPARRNSERSRLPWYDAVASAAGFCAGWYVAIRYPALIDRVFEMPPDAIVVSVLFFVLAIEGLRRSVGYSLVVVVLAFTAYALVGHLIPGPLQSRDVELLRMLVYLGLDSSALLGLVLHVGVVVVIPFIFFGQLLLRSGASSFFNDISTTLMGRYRGGSAKIAVVGSSLFGTISGVVVSNILATGVVTIPLMKKGGYSPRLAAAIEATASNGGQLMPPVMGAVAFLMADFLQRPYQDIVIAAIVPSVLYYVALFIQADLEAAKLGIQPLDRSEIPPIGTVLATGWIYLLPFAVLVYALFWANREPEVAALWAAVTVLILGIGFGYHKQRMPARRIVDCLIETGIATIDIFMIVAAAGFVIGILQLTGLGFAVTLFLTGLGAGNLIALLFIAALVCIVLGMGMPTLGVYVLLAVLIAPALVEVGISPLAAHMFIIYLGMMSMVTPPVAIGAFFAANLAGAEPMRTGFTAMRFGWTAYIVPFLFVFAPSLLLQEPSVLVTTIAITTAVAGVWLASAAMVGYLVRPLPWLTRLALLVAGSALILPPEIGVWSTWVNLLGLVLAAAIVGYEVRAKRRLNSAMSA